MLKLSSSKEIRIDVPVLSVSWCVEDHSVIIQALRKRLVVHEASDAGGVPRWKSSCPDRLAEATYSIAHTEEPLLPLCEQVHRYTGIHSITVTVQKTRCSPPTHAIVPSFYRPRKYQDKHDQLSKSNTITFLLLQKNIRMFLFVKLLFLPKLSNFTSSEPGEQPLLAAFFFSVWQDPSL